MEALGAFVGSLASVTRWRGLSDGDKARCTTAWVTVGIVGLAGLAAVTIGVPGWISGLFEALLAGL